MVGSSDGCIAAPDLPKELDQAVVDGPCRGEIDLAAEVSGKVVWVHSSFESGGRVRKGQPLFRIDDADYRNAVEQARADVAFQQVELLKAEEESEIARGEYEDFRRRQGGEGVGSEANPLTLREPQLAAAQAALARAEAALAEAELRLARTEVRAPFTGVVRSETADIGQFAAAGRSVARLYPADAVEVIVSLADAAAALLPGLWELRAGDANHEIDARVIAEVGGGRYVWNGYVDRVEAALDEQTRTLDVIVRVPDPFRGGVPEGGAGEGGGAGDDEGNGRGDGNGAAEDGADGGGPPLLVGRFVDVELDGAAPGAYFRVRRPALRPGNEVWAVRNERLRIVPVDVLQRMDDEVWVTGDLVAGEPVVVGGLPVGTDGTAVRTAGGTG